MPIGKIEGTESTRKMIRNVVAELQQRKPDRSIDHSIVLKEGNHHTDLFIKKNEGILDEKSVFSIDNSIKAVIDNPTGDITIEKRPFFISVNEVGEKFRDFLNKLQPENRVPLRTPKSDFQIDHSKPKSRTVEEYAGYEITLTDKEI